MYIYSFEKLRVWALSKELAVKIYTLTNKFPPSEKYGMANQLRRAIISVCSNIAEGSTRKSKKEQAHFYTIAYGSIVEALNQIMIAYELAWIDEQSLTALRSDIEFITSRLNALRNAALGNGENDV
jgi:four helix bundle protein